VLNNTPIPATNLEPNPYSTPTSPVITPPSTVGFYEKNKPTIFGIAGVVTLLLLLIVIFKPFDEKEVTDTTTITGTEQPAELREDKTAKLIEEGNNALNNKEFVLAITKFKEADRNDLVEKVVQQWMENAAEVGKSDPQRAINILEDIKRSGGNTSVVNDAIAEYQKKINDAARAEQERKDKEAAKKEREKEAKNKVNPKDDCTFGGSKKTADQYLKDIEEQEIKKGRYASAVSCCDLIINAECTTPAQKDKAKSLKRQAQANM
jgi:hypothetical protein